MREHARLRRAVVTALAGVVALLLVPVASWGDSGAEVVVSNTRVRVGDQVQVTGKGFTPGDTVAVAVCGAADASGRLACGEGLTDVLVAADGTVNQALTVHEPAGPCPCTIVVDGPEGPPDTARIELLGYAVLKKPKAPEVVVDSATLERSGGFGHWFGLSPEPTLQLTLRNAGSSAAQPALDLSWRDGDGEPVAIVDSGVPVIEPGDSVEFSIPLDLGAFAQGEHTVAGQVVVGDLFAPVEARTTVGPWGLYVLVAGALVGGAMMRARRVTAPAAAGAPPQRLARRAAPARTVPAPRAPSRRAAEETAGREPRSEPRRSEPRRKERQEQTEREPAYVGPPRLEATPLAPLTSLRESGPQDDQATQRNRLPQGDRPSSQTLSPLERLSASAPGRTTTATAPGVRVPTQGSASRMPARDDAQQAAPAPAPTQSVRQVPEDDVPVVQIQQDPAQDMATVAQAMAAIAERSGESPTRLPDTVAVPPQPGRRADRGGKRAARPAKGAWITRR